MTTFHMVPPPSRGLRGWIQETSIRTLKAISSRRVYVSEKTRLEFRDSGLVILNGVDIENIRASLGQRDALRRELGLSGCVIVFAGRKARIKGYWDLIRALHSARQGGADARLLSTGSFPDDESQECERLIQDLGLGAFLVDLGERNDHLRFLAAADVFALPSYREGLPMALLEAMAARLPIIASTVGGIPELVSRDVSDFLRVSRNCERKWHRERRRKPD